MIAFSIIAYIVLTAWYFFGNEKGQRISTIIGVCISSFWAYWFWDVDNTAMVIYIIMGVVCTFFHWISVDVSQKSGTKNKVVAALLAFFLGGYGIHRFYLRKSTSGLLYILFCWSLIPGVIAIVEGICLLVMPQEKFNAKYNVHSKAIFTQERHIPEAAGRGANYTSPLNDNFDIEDNCYTGVNERDGDNLNYRDLRLCGYRAEAVGNLEDFTITVRSNGKTYTFKAKDGDICSYRSSTMRGAKRYEVT